MRNTLEEKIKEECVKYEGLPVALSGGVDSSLLATLIKSKFVISVDIKSDTHGEIEHAKKVAAHLGLLHVIVNLDDSKFDEYVTQAVKAIGRPIPHFNIFPLFAMYKQLAEMGETKLVLGDGPDETMCGYARDLIVKYLYDVYEFEAFKPYSGLIDKILPPLRNSVFNLTGLDTDSMLRADIAMRRDMDDMSNKIAAHFGVTNIRPYQDNPELDNFMLNLPMKKKVYKVEYGKYALRQIAEKYLPKEIAWRKVKVGGPVYPVNKVKGWLEKGEFDKTKWLEYQKAILDGNN